MKQSSIIVISVVGVIAVLFLGLRFVNLSRVSERGVEAEQGNFKLAPDFSLLDLDGNEKKLFDFKGKVIILDFWATWCPPCKAEIPHFIELYDEYKNEGLEIIGVALDTGGKSVVGTFAMENGINYIVLLGDRDVTDLYGSIISIPTTFVIDREGKIRKKYIGYRDKEVFEEDIRELL